MKILLLGKGVSNNGVKRLLEEKNISFDMLDSNEVLKYDYDIVVKSPGISNDIEVIKKFKELNINVISDIEFIYNLIHPNIIGVTGSNGKTSVVNLIYQMIKEDYKATLCGNMGYPLGQAVTEHPNQNFYVCELSSFMLNDIINFSPKISVILNIKPCHLDVHKTFHNYLTAKKNITVNQTPSDYLVYNLDDPNLKGLSKNSVAKKVTFSLNSTLSNCYIFANHIYLDGKKVVSLKNLKLKGNHNIYNAMASICVAKTLNISNKAIKKVLSKNDGVDYRLTKIGNKIYNDAKSTNPYSTIEALKTLDDKVYLICGGYDKNEYLESLIPYLKYINKVFVYGMSKKRVYDFFKENNIDVTMHMDLKQATLKALSKKEEEIILFSPMFSSLDMYKSFEDRAKEFNDIYNKYIKEKE